MTHTDLILTGRPISASYQNLLQFSGSGATSTLVQADGNDFNYTASFSNTSSWAVNAVSANPPTQSTDIATKGYVDGLFQGNGIFYLSATGSGVGTDYFLKLSGSSPATITISTGSVGNDAYVFNWITPPNIPNITIYPDGLYHIDHTTRITAPGNTVTIFPEIYLANAAGVEYFELGTVATPFILTDTFQRVQQDIIVSTPITASVSDRLVVKLKITNTGTNTIETQVEGTTLSHFATPISNANFITNVNTASVAISASYAATSSWAINAINGGTQLYTGSTYPITASWVITASVAISASYAATSSWAINAINGGTQLYTGSTYPITASNALSASNARTASYALNATTSSYSVTASNAHTASYALNATTSSYALNATSASWAATSSFVSINETYYNQYLLRTNTVVSSANTLPVRKADPITFVEGNKIYIIGGWNSTNGGQNGGTNTIYTASIDRPELVRDSGATFPINICRAMCVKIGNTLYMYGGASDGVIINKIFSASVSNPLSWVSSSNTLPTGIFQSSALVLNDKVWIFFGQATEGYSSASYSASISNPTVFGLAGAGIAGSAGSAIFQGNVIANSGKLYLYGGFNWLVDGNFTANSRIFTASVSNPAAWGIGASGLVQIPSGQTPPLAIGDVTYTFGGFTAASTITNKIYAYSASAPLVPVDTGHTIPVSGWYHSTIATTSSLGIPYMAMYGGGDVNTSDAFNYIRTGSIITNRVNTTSSSDFTKNISWKYLQYTSQSLNTDVYPITVATASWAINVVNGGSGGTTLYTASTYPITSSWAVNVVNGGVGSSESSSWASASLSSSYVSESVMGKSVFQIQYLTSASYAAIASPVPTTIYVIQDLVSAVTTVSASYSDYSANSGQAASVVSASYAETASYASNAGGGSGTTLYTGSTYPITASWAQTASAFSSISGSNNLFLQCTDGNTYQVALDKDGANVVLAIGQTPVTESNSFLQIGTVNTLTTGSTQPITASFSNTSSYPWAVNGTTASHIGKVGIGTSSPGALLGVSGSVAVGWEGGQIFGSDYTLTVKSSGVGTALFMNTGNSGVGGGAGMQGHHDDGAEMSSGDRLGFFVFGGARDTAHSLTNGAAIEGFAAENWSGTTAATDLRIGLTPSGQLTRNSVVWISSSGSVGIGNGYSPSCMLDVTGSHVASVGIARFRGPQYGFLSLDTTTAGATNEAGFLLSIGGVLHGQFGARGDDTVYIKNRVHDAGDVMTFDSSGKVGIGISSSIVNALDVNGNISCSIITASLFNGTSSFAKTASIMTPTSPYATITTSSTNWITCSFLDAKEYVNITTGLLYNFTCSNPPPANQYSNVMVFINNTATATSSVAFPTNWTFIGVAPSSITASKNAYLNLECFGGQVVAGLGQQY